MRSSSVILSASSEAALRGLKASKRKDAKSIARRVLAIIGRLRVDPLQGEVVRRGSIPLDLVARYDFDALFVEDLPSFWRLLYSVTRDETGVHVAILEIVDHRGYDRWFPSRGR